MGEAGLPALWTQALLDALQLFSEVQGDVLGSEQARHDVRYTLWHFPDEVTIRAMARTHCLGEWLRQQGTP